jgi:hypothetical protein
VGKNLKNEDNMIKRVKKEFDPYEGITDEEKELYNSVPPADTMTPVKETLTVLFLFGVFYIWLVIGSVS